MYCTKCGINNDSKAQQCASCGADLLISNEKDNLCQRRLRSISNMVYAGFWRRLAAYIIDLLALAPVIFVIHFLVMVLSQSTGFWGTIDSMAANLLDSLAFLLYFALMESSLKQATLGKMALGITVTDNEGWRISLLRAMMRQFFKYLSALFLFIGFIMIAFTDKKEGLHDMIAGCLVIKKLEM